MMNPFHQASEIPKMNLSGILNNDKHGNFKEKIQNNSGIAVAVCPFCDPGKVQHVHFLRADCFSLRLWELTLVLWPVYLRGTGWHGSVVHQAPWSLQGQGQLHWLASVAAINDHELLG